jgi:hypothetical protein
MNRLTLIFSLIILTCCSSQSSDKNLKIANSLANKINNEKELFYTFIDQFSTDSEFQLDRIRFPLSLQTQKENSSIEKIDWEHDYLYAPLQYSTYIINAFNFTFDYNMDFGDKAIFSWIYPSLNQEKGYYFERENGEWYLSKIVYSPLAINSQEDFIPFLKKFMSDSTFQLSRVKFPIELKTWYDSDEEEFADTTYVLNQSDWNFNSIYNGLDSLTNFVYSWDSNIRIKDEVRLFLGGVENGICVDYYFKIIDNKWYLIKKSDEST